MTATSATVAAIEDPVTVARDGVEAKVDGVILPPIINTKVIFDQEKKRYVKLDGKLPTGNVYEVVEKEKTNLLKAMKDFQSTAKGSFDVDIDPNKYQDWKQVEHVMRDAEKDYATKHRDKPMMRGIVEFFNNVGDSGGIFQAWLSLLPTGEYSSIICGAFKLVIKSCIRLNKIRDLILSSLGKIPQALQTAKQYLEMRNLYKSVELHIEFSRLYKAILEFFRHILDWMSKSSFKHAAVAFWKQDDYEKDLEDKLSCVWDQATAVRQQAEICSQFLIGDIHQNLEIQTHNLAGVRVTIEGVKTDVEGLGKVLIKSQSRIEDRLNAFFNLFQDMARDLKSTQADVLVVPKATKLTPRKLIETLKCSSKVIKKDINKAISTGKSSDNAFQERAQALMGHAHLKSWITNAKSQMLLVNGNGHRDKISPMTLACGILTQSLKSFEGAISLVFFCGMHSEMTSDEDGPELILAYLIHQLLTSYPTFNLDFILKSQKKQDIINHDLDTLCFIFDGLVRQLTEDQIVFCLIDGITFFEYGNRKRNARQTISTILDLVEESNCVFKLLVTSATKSIVVHNLFLQDTILNLRAESMRQLDQGLNIRRVLEKKSKSMESLSSERHKKVHSQDEWSLSDSDREDEVTSSSISVC
ncbi:hypothetical protein F5884DRAFT_384116 [Xylogone sp. PMI_703]|nr:hypothetical protein F5884DRAFT_384116 [Xylogone sp. PMI_703]